MPDDVVLELAEAFAREQVPNADAWRLLAPAFRDLAEGRRRERLTTDALACVSLPRLVHAAIAGDEERARPLTVALLLLHIGTELLDDAIDGDLGPAWQGFRPDEVTAAAAALGATLAPLALARIDAPPPTLLAMHAKLAGGLLTMFQGQASDMALMRSADATSAAVEASVVGKCGGAVAMYTALGALLAGAPVEDVERYAEVGRCLGVAAQVRSDCADLFVAADSRDLATGNRTLPIAFLLERLDGDERDGVLTLLDRARREPAAREAVRDRLREAVVLRDCAALVERYCERARDALDNVAGREPAAGRLRRIVESKSFMGSGSDGGTTAASAVASP